MLLAGILYIMLAAQLFDISSYGVAVLTPGILMCMAPLWSNEKQKPREKPPKLPRR